MSIFDPRFRHNHPSGAAAIALYRIGQTINYLLRTHAEETKLSPAQMQALLFLRFARPGVHTIGGLAQRLSISYATARDRKSTRLNSSHTVISYAVFCLEKKRTKPACQRRWGLNYLRFRDRTARVET